MRCHIQTLPLRIGIMWTNVDMWAEVHLFRKYGRHMPRYADVSHIIFYIVRVNQQIISTSAKCKDRS